MNRPQADKLIRVYLKIRTARQDLKEKYDAEDSLLEEQMNTIQSKLLDFCKESGLDSLKTPFGTASKVVKSRYWTSDWDSFRTFAKENDALELFEKRIHQGAMKEFLEENPDNIPIGLNVSHEYAITVRKSK